MLWENSSVAVAVVAVVVVAHPGLGRGQLSVLLRLRRFRDARIDPSRLPSADGIRNKESCRREKIKYQRNVEQNITNHQKWHSIKITNKNPSLLSP